MKKVLFILQKKNYNKKYIIYIKMLKIIGYKIHIITDIEDSIKYCEKIQKSIFKINNNEYEMIFCNSKII